MRILVRPLNLRVPRTSTRSLVPARVCFQLGGLFYPDSDWIDNILIIIGWWCDEAVRLKRGLKSVRLNFMEGDFRVLVTREKNTLSMVGDGMHQAVSEGVELPELFKELRRAIDAIYEHSDEFQLETAELTQLFRYQNALAQEETTGDTIIE
jgi:hypothetical protein